MKYSQRNMNRVMRIVLAAVVAFPLLRSAQQSNHAAAAFQKLQTLAGDGKGKMSKAVK